MGGSSRIHVPPRNINKYTVIRPTDETARASSYQSPVPVNAETAKKRPSTYCMPGELVVMTLPPTNAQRKIQHKTVLKKFSSNTALGGEVGHRVSTIGFDKTSCNFIK